MWRWIAGLAAIPVGAAALVCGIGLLLPRNHVAVAEAVIPAPPAAVAARIRDVAAYPGWRSGVERIEGLERDGNGTRFVEHSDNGAIAFLLTEEARDARFKSLITDPRLPFGGYWTITLAREGAGTRIRIEEHGSVGNPVYRFFSALIFGHDRTMKAYLADFARATGR